MKIKPFKNGKKQEFACILSEEELAVLSLLTGAVSGLPSTTWRGTADTMWATVNPYYKVSMQWKDIYDGTINAKSTSKHLVKRIKVQK